MNCTAAGRRLPVPAWARPSTIVFAGDCHAIGTCRPCRPSPQSSGGLRILIIEDNRDAAESLRLLLDLSGHAIRVAHTGERGLEIARAFWSWNPIVILCDIGLLGGFDGFAIAAGSAPMTS